MTSEARKEYMKEWRKKNKDALAEYWKKRYEKDKENLNKESKKRYEKNKDKIIAKAKEYYENNKEKVAEYKLKHYEQNHHKYVAASKKRKAARIQRTPCWITAKQIKQIENFYAKAKKLEEKTGIKHHVDHIIPLQGKLVSGLHVPENLQILTARENLRKNNRYVGA